MRSFVSQLILEDIFSSVPTNNTNITRLANDLFYPRVPLVSKDCGTVLGVEEPLLKELEGEVLLSTNQKITNNVFNTLVSSNYTNVRIRDKVACVETTGLCKSCYNASLLRPPRSLFSGTNVNVVDNTSISITKVAPGVAAVWDTQASSSLSYSSGITLSFKIPTGAISRVGLSTTKTIVSLYSFQGNSGGVIYIIEGSTVVGSFGTATANTLYTIEYGINTVTYRVDGIVVRQVTVAENQELYANIGMYGLFSTVSELYFIGNSGSSKEVVSPLYYYRTDILSGIAGQTDFIVADVGDTSIYSDILIFINGLLLPKGLAIVSGTNITLSYPLSVASDVIVKYVYDTKVPFMQYLSNTYSGALLGLEQISITRPLPIRAKVLTSLINDNVLSSCVTDIKALSIVPDSIKNYVDRVQNKLEKALLVLATYCIYGNM